MEMKTQKGKREGIIIVGAAAMVEELLDERRPTAMSTSNTSSSSTFRFVAFSSQPQPAIARIHDPLELHESDVVWSFAVSSAPPVQNHQHQHEQPHRLHEFKPAASSGLSSILSDDHRHLIRRKSTVSHAMVVAPSSRFHQSAPMNIPLWPRELRQKCGVGESDGFDEAGEDDGGGKEGKEEMVPPHVIVARSHVTFSVFEGAGRTLKGRDLRRVRNAVFQKTGFID